MLCKTLRQGQLVPTLASHVGSQGMVSQGIVLSFGPTVYIFSPLYCSVYYLPTDKTLHALGKVDFHSQSLWHNTFLVFKAMQHIDCL